MWIVRLLLGRWIHSSTPWVWLSSSVILGFTCAHSGGRWVYPGSLGSSARAEGVDMFSFPPSLCLVGFIRGRRALSRPSCSSLGLCGDVGFARACPVGGWIHPRSMASLAHGLVIFGFIRCRWVRSRASWEWLGSYVVVGFVLGCRVLCRVHSWSVTQALEVVEFEFFGFPHARPGSLLVLPGSLCSLTRYLGVIRDRWVHSGSLRSLPRDLGWLRSFGIIGFARTLHGGICVHL